MIDNLLGYTPHEKLYTTCTEISLILKKILQFSEFCKHSSENDFEDIFKNPISSLSLLLSWSPAFIMLSLTSKIER